MVITAPVAAPWPRAVLRPARAISVGAHTLVPSPATAMPVSAQGVAGARAPSTLPAAATAEPAPKRAGGETAAVKPCPANRPSAAADANTAGTRADTAREAPTL